MPATPDPTVDVATAVASVPWYHSIELPGGVVTPGEYDLRSIVGRVPLPGSLSGRRCLDVGTHDGFWAFEMERRGAAEVVAIDLDDWARLDWPAPRPDLNPGAIEFLARRRRAFSIARDALGSKVDRRDLSVYDLSPDEVGEFDFAFIGTLLHHLRDPVGALMAIRRVVRGQLLVCGVFSVLETMLHPRHPVASMLPVSDPFWEVPNIAGLRRQVVASGWEIEQVTKPFFQPYGDGAQVPPLNLHPRAWSGIPKQLLLRYGAPHIALLAHPR